MKIKRRHFLAGSAAGIAMLSVPACTAGIGKSAAEGGFITRDGMKLMRDGQPFRITGMNMWYAAWVGADAPYGNRARLLRELDRLSALGVNNIRLMAAAEEGPLTNSVRPGFTDDNGSANTALEEGLDFAMAEIARRGMTAVLVLGNFWEWSGGFQTLLYRINGTFMNNGDPAHPWPEFGDSTAEFYANKDAVALYHDHLRRMVSRTNSATGKPYAEDPAILSWQLGNEPRPGGSDAAIARNKHAYLDWIERTAGLIRSLDPNHLVSLGQEGLQATNGEADLVQQAHQHVDYLTAHIWPLNWGWTTGDDLQGTWPVAEQKAKAYIAAHVDLARTANKPLVIEEFGFPRDGETYSPETTTQWRDKFYGLIYDAVETSWKDNGPLIGSNVWAWNGEARAAHDDHRFVNGDNMFMGDPPHEPQGWYGVFDSDESSLGLIRRNASRRCLGLSKPCPA